MIQLNDRYSGFIQLTYIHVLHVLDRYSARKKNKTKTIIRRKTLHWFWATCHVCTTGYGFFFFQPAWAQHQAPQNKTPVPTQASCECVFISPPGTPSFIPPTIAAMPNHFLSLFLHFCSLVDSAQSLVVRV